MAVEKMPSILACDVGNSGVRFADVAGEDVGPLRTVRVGRLGALADELATLWQQMEAPKKLVAASVNPTALKALEAAAAEGPAQEVLVVGRDLPLPMDTDLPDPSGIGVDRLCCAVAAFDRLGAACVVADFGTAVTIDCVNDDGVFLGGAIMPGLTTAAESLRTHTAQLPAVELVVPDWVYGRDTREAIIGGLVHGARGALREITELYATALGRWPMVILTGGDAKLICQDVGNSGLVQAVVPELALHGVAIAYYKTLLR